MQIMFNISWSLVIHVTNGQFSHTDTCVMNISGKKGVLTVLKMYYCQSQSLALKAMCLEFSMDWCQSYCFMCFFALLGFSFLLKNSGGFNHSKNNFIGYSSIAKKIVQKLKASNLYQNQERQKVSEPSIIGYPYPWPEVLKRASWQLKGAGQVLRIRVFSLVNGWRP